MHVEHRYTLEIHKSYYSTFHLFVVGVESQMKPISSFVWMLKRKGYSEKAIREIWKWYDFVERGGVNFG
jgi:hypothetical protein